MDADPRYLLASECPGVLDNTPLRCEYDSDTYAPEDAGWTHGIWISPEEVTEGGDLLDSRRLRIRLDSRRPEVRDRLARWLAERLGVECGTTAPTWRRTTGSLGGYVLVCGPRPRAVIEFSATEPHPARGNLPQAGVIHVPALSDIPLDSPDRDVLALVAVCRAVGRTA